MDYFSASLLCVYKQYCYSYSCVISFNTISDLVAVTGFIFIFYFCLCLDCWIFANCMLPMYLQLLYCILLEFDSSLVGLSGRKDSVALNILLCFCFGDSRILIAPNIIDMEWNFWWLRAFILIGFSNLIRLFSILSLYLECASILFFITFVECSHSRA